MLADGFKWTEISPMNQARGKFASAVIYRVSYHYIKGWTMYFHPILSVKVAHFLELQLFFFCSIHLCEIKFIP